MINRVIQGFTRMLGAPKDWRPEDHGKCGALAIRDVVETYGPNEVPMPAMVSAWEPTPAELARLVAGAPIYLRILGRGHPPVALWVGDLPPS